MKRDKDIDYKVSTSTESLMDNPIKSRKKPEIMVYMGEEPVALKLPPRIPVEKKDGTIKLKFTSIDSVVNSIRTMNIIMRMMARKDFFDIYEIYCKDGFRISCDEDSLISNLEEFESEIDHIALIRSSDIIDLRPKNT